MLDRSAPSRFRLSPLARLLSRLWRAVAVALLLAPGAAAAPVSDSSPWDAFADIGFLHYDQSSGLPSPVVTAMTEDAAGFLWVGTQGGLGRWDGYRFRSYRPVPGHPEALADAWISALLADQRHRLWVGTTAGGLMRFDPLTQRFTAVAGLPSPAVDALADAGDGRIWVATDGGLALLDPDHGVTTYRHQAGDPGSLPDDHVSAVLVGRDHTVWVATQAGLVRRAAGQDRFTLVSLYPAQAGRRDRAITALFEDSDGQIWVGTRANGAFRIPPGGTAVLPVAETGAGEEPLASDWVATIGAGRAGEVWLGTAGHGIVVVDRASLRTTRIRHRPDAPRSLASDDTDLIYQDRSGGVWVGATGALSRLESAAGVRTLSATGPSPALSEGTVYSILAAADGRVWAGLPTKGIDVIDLERRSVAHVVSQSGAPATTLIGKFVVTMAQSPSGRIYIGSSAGLYQVDADGQHLARVTVAGRDPGASVYMLAVVGDTLWIGGTHDGLWSMRPDRADPQVQHYAADRLTDPRIVSLAPGPGGVLWVGTRNGLNRLDTASGRVERILPRPNDQTALTTPSVTSLLLDRSGRLWASTQGGGIQILTGRRDGAPIFHHVTVADGLPSDNVASLLQDRGGRVWADTEGGIAVLDPARLTAQPLGHADGLPVSVPWDHAAAITRAGDLLFGANGASALTVITPSRFVPWRYAPPLVITDLKLGGVELPTDGLAGAPLVAKAGHNSLDVEFAALDYSAPEDNRYRYWLEGFDKGWIDTDATRRVAAYTNLPPGHYVLHLRGSNRAGVWSPLVLDLPLSVRPAWNQTWGFTAAIALAAILVLALVVRLRTMAMRKRAGMLAALVDRRTAELRESQGVLEDLAYRDTLTGLANRRRFSETMTRLIDDAQHGGPAFALILIDLDHFKRVNDTLGHDAGDALLVIASERFSALVRETDHIARLGGDEFAIIIVRTDDPAGAAQALCRRLVASFASPIRFGAQTVPTSLSIGMAVFPDHGTTQTTLRKAADVALYQTKQAGRNGWQAARLAAIDTGTQTQP